MDGLQKNNKEIMLFAVNANFFTVASTPLVSQKDTMSSTETIIPTNTSL